MKHLALVALLAGGCVESGPAVVTTDLATLVEPTVTVERFVDGAIVVSLDYANADCLVVPNVRVTLDGAQAQIQSPGSWIEPFQEQAGRCERPRYVLAPAAGSTIVVEDDSKTITMVIPEMSTPRPMAIVGDAVLHVGDSVPVTATVAPGDVVNFVAVTATSASCTGESLFEASAATSTSFVVGGTHACAEGIDAGTPVSIQVHFGPQVTARVATCDGAAECTAYIAWGTDVAARFAR